jgi:hypothetical protein
MTRIFDITYRIESQMILCNADVSTDCITLPFDEHMTINPRKYKRLGFRKIKCIMSENPGYPFWISLIYYNRINGGNYMYFADIKINLTNQTSNDIGNEIIAQLNAFLKSNGKLIDFMMMLDMMVLFISIG